MALDLSGSSAYLDKSEASESVPQTLSAWAAPGSVSGNAAIMTANKYGTDASQVYLRRTADDAIAVAVTAANAASTATVADVLAIGVWGHHGGEFSASNNRRAYFNGTYSSAQTVSRPNESLTTMGIGYRNVGTATRGDFWAGQIADTAFYNVALTAREMAARDKGISASLIRPSALVSYAPLIRGSQDWRSRTPFSESGSPTYSRHPRTYL